MDAIKLTSNKTYLELPIDAERKDQLLILQILKNGETVATSQVQYVDEKFYAVVNYCSEMDDTTATYTAKILQVDGLNESDVAEICEEFPVNFNRTKIRTEYKTYHDAELLRLFADLARLDKRIDTQLEKRIKNEIPVCDPTVALKGMVLTVIDDVGNVAFTYPFGNIITEINGKHAIEQKVMLTAEDIEVPALSQLLSEAIVTLWETNKEQSATIVALTEQISAMNLRLKDVEETLVAFKANS